MINQKELRSLLIILRDSFKQIFGDQFERMILYGSRARGDHRLDSDIIDGESVRTVGDYSVESKVSVEQLEATLVHAQEFVETIRNHIIT